ncbi:MAG TPA: hypothetical protein VI299_14055 [Polyangiales bacterium]
MKLVLVLLLASFASSARAERGLLTQHLPPVRAGERLQVELETPHGLTPPPGIQNERALRGFAARLCADAACVPLVALNVRPRDGWSMVYRAEFSLPSALIPGRYALDVRFPGGLARSAGEVEIRPAAKVAPHAVAEAGGCAIASGRARGGPLGLLMVALSWKLAAVWWARARRGNSYR